MNKQMVIDRALAAHSQKFGSRPASIAWAPGRIEVLGNHTDYNEGTVLSAAIDRGHCFCVSPAGHTGIRLLAVDVDQVATFDATDTGRVPEFGWANYVKGVCYLLSQQLNTPIAGIDCTFFGSIPMGSGLSSSAALEVATAYAVLDLLGQHMDGKEIAKLCRHAEHQFAGTNCGLLDQFSSIFGEDHGLIHSDFRSLEVTSVPLPGDVAFLVVNPHVKHSLADSPYNERRERCEQAATELAALLAHPVTALRDVSVEEFESLRDRIDPAAARRAAHVVGEIDRVERGTGFLKTRQLESFGELLFASHLSSITNFENSCPELDVVVEAARTAGAPGARLSGGGFGGCAIVMVHTQDAEAISKQIIAHCAGHGIVPDILPVIPSAGAHIVSN